MVTISTQQMMPAMAYPMAIQMPQKISQMTLRTKSMTFMGRTFSRLVALNYDHAMPADERVHALRG
ncbi:hypothetical protein [Kitasatospora cathayae]|uniref:Uncharacterized protein n=1 Tax=Kitasatospora cathayae TaxID=3004092 RepID=A0ABY7QJ82_9ACTN|nr:hypothetical protein [Kitasatospora sp. HUAS 3-15]WBP91926.1 hypothetical protein O1G21_31955 [Kitasatospora sp. HUAS 3-15]